MLSRHSLRAAHSAAKNAASTPKPEQVTKLPNGLTVASVDNYGALSQLVLAFRAGSRYESPAQGGLVHHIRNAVGRDSEDFHGMNLVWGVQQAGGNLNAFATRDLYGVALSVPRDQTALGLSILGNVAARPAFKPWELEDAVDTVRIDNAHKDPYQAVFEDIHRAAYRNGSLANSIYAAKHQIGKYKYDVFCEFANKHFLSGNAVLFGVNIDHESLRMFGDNNLPIRHGKEVAPLKSSYKGGDWRRQTKSDFAHVLIAGEGAAGNDAKALATQAVLLTALGRSPNVTYESTVGVGSLAKSQGSAALSAFQAVHAESGLAGVYVVAQASNIEETVRKVAAAIRAFKPTNLEAAKRRATMDALRASAHSAPHSIERTAQLFNGLEDKAIVNAIKQVSANDVEAAAKKIASKFSVAALGATTNVPYADSL